MPDQQDCNVSGEHSEAKPYRGEVVYIYAFDLAYDMKREPIEKLLGQPVQDYLVGPSKRSPKSVFFYRPQMVNLATVQVQGQRGSLDIQRSVKLFNVGAISVQVRVPFAVDRIEELVGFHNLRLASGTVEDNVNELAEKIRQELEPYCVRPVPRLGKGEDYTVFCLYELHRTGGDQNVRAENWLANNRRQVAALLTQEEDAMSLSGQEAAESTEQYLSYYDSDLVVVDWDAALIVGERDSLNDVLHIMELANVQLVELAAYDRILDGSLQLAYRDVTSRRAHPWREVQRNLREIRVDLSRFNDELLNITKFFGDWHLARVYRNVSSRFHLEDWHRVISEKLKTLGDLYQLLQQDWVNFWMVVLETTIVLLFLVDVALILYGL